MTRRSDVPVGELCRLYGSGRSLRALAAEFGVSTGTVRTRLVDAGVVLRGRGAPRTPVDVTALVYETHLLGSQRGAARALGVSRVTAHRRLSELRSPTDGPRFSE